MAIDRLPEIKPALVTEFTVDVQAPHRLDQQVVDASIAAAEALVVTPPECKTAANNAPLAVNMEVVAVAASNAQASFVIQATASPQPTTVSPDPSGCAEFTTEAPDETSTTAQIVDAPEIAGVTTRGVHSTVAINEPLTGNIHAVDQFVFSARLDDRHLVTVTSSANPRVSKAAGERAKKLLVQAVDVVRRPA
ncbi:MAG: DUF5642 family protein [Mycobacterium sp.]